MKTVMSSYNSDKYQIILLSFFLLFITVSSCANPSESSIRLAANEIERNIVNDSDTDPDSIVIIYQAGVFSHDCIKILITPDKGIVEWFKKTSQIRERVGQPPLAFCDWQRDEISMLVKELFVKKKAKVLERGDVKSLNTICPGPSSLEFSIYIGTTCFNEKINDIYLVKTPYYSKQFFLLYNHIKAIFLAYDHKYPWACENESKLCMDFYENEAADSITIDCLNLMTDKSYHIILTDTICCVGKVTVTSTRNNDLKDFYYLDKAKALQLYKQVSDLFANGPESFNCEMEYFDISENKPYLIPIDVVIKLHQSNNVSSFSIKTSLFNYRSHLNIPQPLGLLLGRLIIEMHRREGLRGLD